MLTFLFACTNPEDSAPKEETGLPDTDSGVTDTDTECDPTVGSIAHPNFASEALPVGTEVLASSLDAGVTLDADVPHLVYVPTSVTKTRVFVMLSDLGGSPADHEKLLGISTLGGQRSIGLAWPSSVQPEALCGDDLDCRYQVIDELLTGTDTSALVTVPRADSVEARLLALVTGLETASPGQGWSSYYSGETLVADQIVLAGFGVGASLASRYGQGAALAGNVLLGGACEAIYETDGSVTTYAECGATRATVADRIYGLLHMEDDFDRRSPAFAALAVDQYGDWTSADLYEPRYCTSTHLLTTQLPDEPRLDEFHLAVAHDDYISVDDRGMPLDANDYWFQVTLADR